MKAPVKNSAKKRLGVREFKVGMKVQWRKGGDTTPSVLEVVKTEKTSSGKTVIHFKHPDGKISSNLNAGNRYVAAD